MNSGKLLILLILGVALVAATVAWQHQLSRGARALELWGSENAYLIRHAPLVRLHIGDDPQPIDMSQAAGLSHARQALIEDASFMWDGDPIQTSEGKPRWDCKIEFAAAQRSFTLRLDFDRGIAESGADGRQVRLSQRLADGLQLFFAEHQAPAP